jgi:hypothetical protein
VRHYVGFYHLDRCNLTATFPEHYSLVRMSPNDARLFILFVVVICFRPFVVVFFVDSQGESDFPWDRLAKHYGGLAGGLQCGKGARAQRIRTTTSSHER